MNGVHFANENNSTPFSDCCGVAVVDELKCPKCGKLINVLPKDRFRHCMRYGYGLKLNQYSEESKQ